jgi:uncharacterized coiled-coil DUF342 family protein
MQTKENNSLRDRILTLMNNLAEQDKRGQDIADELIELRMALDASNTEVRHLRGERDILKSSEARMMTENQGLIQQRNMANDHLKGLQMMFDDVDRNAKENIVKFEERSAKMETEMFVFLCLHLINGLMFFNMV